MLLCSKGYDIETRDKCTQILKSTIQEIELYQSIKSKEKAYREIAEAQLTKTGFWFILTGISTVSTGKIQLTGHNVMGIDAVNLTISETPQIAATWTF
jgi:hypothetical protein